MGRIRAVSFAEDYINSNLLALGTTIGLVQLWDTGEDARRLRIWPSEDWAGATVVAWKGGKGEEFVVGRNDGNISLYDVRMDNEATKWKGHRGDVFGAQWSHDQRFLATVDNRGIVHVWDSRKLTSKVAKMKHTGPAKVRRSSGRNSSPHSLVGTGCGLASR